MTLPNADSYDTYGGELTDYSVVEDPQTDLSAESSNELRADIAAMTSTCFRCVITWHIDDPGGANTPTVDDVKAVWNTDLTTPPTIARLSEGVYEITFPTTVFDVRGNEQTFAILGSFAGFNAAGIITTAQVIDSQTIDIFINDIATAAVSDAVGTTAVYVR